MDLRGADIAVLGASGAVGCEMLSILAERGVPADRIRALTSARSAGDTLEYGATTVEAVEVGTGSFDGIDVALFAASSDASRRFATVARAAGATVVDNSSAFRMDPDVPLVVPEVNPEAMHGATTLIANPNCSTIVLLVVLTPLHRLFGCERIVVSTYQAVSGAGKAAMDELTTQTRALLEGHETPPEVFGEPCAFNVFSHDSAMDPVTGRNLEEEKLIRETRKIWSDDTVGISPTCLRVPVLRAHTESVNVTLRREATEPELRDAINAAPGVRLVDDRAANAFPTPRKASGVDDVLVGRLRPAACVPATASDAHRVWDLLLCGDQLRKGAALNAIQIAELIER